MVTMTEREERREHLSLSEISDGRYVSSAEAASILDVPESTLRTLVSERQNGGRSVKSGDKTFDVPVSARANLLPEPVGVVTRALVWEASEIEAIAAEFQTLKTARGRKPKAE